jgi:ketosteroid isomerase-like protein
MTDNAEAVRAVFRAFEEDDREALEGLIAPELVCTSPADFELDRAAYFERCWPAHEMIERFELVRVIEQGETVVVTYESTNRDGKRGRNTEIFTLAEGKVAAVEVYFGWDLD